VSQDETLTSCNVSRWGIVSQDLDVPVTLRNHASRLKTQMWSHWEIVPQDLDVLVRTVPLIYAVRLAFLLAECPPNRAPFPSKKYIRSEKRNKENHSCLEISSRRFFSCQVDCQISTKINHNHWSLLPSSLYTCRPETENCDHIWVCVSKYPTRVP
jgi:hypothetical protein